MDGWGAVAGLKQTLKHKGQCCAICRWAILAQLTGKARSADRLSMAPNAVLLMPLGATQAMKCTLLVWQHRKKATCKSRLSHLVSSAWCLWIVHECGFHLRTGKNGFRYLCPKCRFSKLQSQMSLNLGEILNDWKRAYVSPIF